MTGWSEAELVGRTAPFPYWPEPTAKTDRSAGRRAAAAATPGGFQVRVKRKDGTLFDARLYVSPLIDAVGKQTGWMTSMTDITEPNRIREQLSASHERFTTCWRRWTPRSRWRRWAATSCCLPTSCTACGLARTPAATCSWWPRPACPTQPTNDDSLDERGFVCRPAHRHADDAQSENAEIYLCELGKWLEVRTRYLNWVDGRLAQMVIATDITPRRLPRAGAAQAERAQSPAA
jgi:PAS domain S-box-containing protein